MKPDEKGFEEAIEADLLEHGWLRSVPSNFDSLLGLDTAELYAFIGSTQVREWEKLLGMAADGRSVFRTAGLFTQSDGIYIQDASGNTIGGTSNVAGLASLGVSGSRSASSRSSASPPTGA